MADPLFDPAFALETPVTHGEMILDWLTESQKTPARFAAALEQRALMLGVGQPKGRSDSGTDLYHELVARHALSGRLALRCYRREELSGQGSFEDLSFAELHARCTHRASWWATQGVGPATVVGIVFPFGVEFVVSLLAALRLGAVAAPLEPDGVDYVLRRLASLAPQHVATDEFLARRLEAFADLVLPPDSLAPPLETSSHTYESQQICMKLFSPLRLNSSVPVPVTAAEIYQGALRDGLCSLALRPGDHAAAPGFFTQQVQPALLFAALSCGAVWTHLREQDVVRDPTLLEQGSLRTLGLTPRVRDAYLKHRRGHKPPWSHVMRNPEEACDWQAWSTFISSCDLADTSFSNVVLDSASAGTLLCSPRRLGKHFLSYLQSVVPAPGQTWQLLDFTRSGQAAAADTGVYARVAEGKKPKPLLPQYLVLARRGSEYLYGGTLEPRRAGRVIPTEEVLAAAAKAPFVEGAAVAPVASGGSASEWRFVLVVFTGQERGEAFDAALLARRSELQRLLVAALGEAHVPDRIELFSLHAKRGPAGVDQDWAQSQYLSGTLFRKARTPLFQRMVALRRAVRADAAGPPRPEKETPWA